MSDKTQTLRFSQEIKAPVAEVYFAFTNQPLMQAWFADVVEIDLKEKGRLYAWWNQGYYATGIITKVEENEKVVFKYQGLGEPAATKISVSFEEKDGGTLLTLKHKGLGEGEKWEGTLKNVKKAWPVALENLQWLVEKGVDKRIYDRPFMGIYIAGELNEEQAETLGMPVTAGIRLTGAVEGTGAAEVVDEAGDQ